MSDRVEPKVGQFWISKDSRDYRVSVKIIEVTADRVYFVRSRRSSVRLDRWHKEYELARG